MSSFLKTVFQPLSNRHYTNKRLSVLNYAYGYLPSLVVCLLAALFVDERFLWLIPIVILYGAIDYLLFDGTVDKITWKLFWGKYYDEKHFENTTEHDAIKAYENNPSEVNRKALGHHFLNPLILLKAAPDLIRSYG